jgi:hypothetical protein
LTPPKLCRPCNARLAGNGEKVELCARCGVAIAEFALARCDELQDEVERAEAAKDEAIRAAVGAAVRRARVPRALAGEPIEARGEARQGRAKIKTNWRSGKTAVHGQALLWARAKADAASAEKDLTAARIGDVPWNKGQLPGDSDGNAYVPRGRVAPRAQSLVESRVENAGVGSIPTGEASGHEVPGSGDVWPATSSAPRNPSTGRPRSHPRCRLQPSARWTGPMPNPAHAGRAPGQFTAEELATVMEVGGVSLALLHRKTVEGLTLGKYDSLDDAQAACDAALIEAGFVLEGE